MVKPGIYTMSPKFIADPRRRECLTRVVRVERIEEGRGQDGKLQQFAFTVELTTSKSVVFGVLVWEAGKTAVRELNKWKFVPT